MNKRTNTQEDAIAELALKNLKHLTGIQGKWKQKQRLNDKDVDGIIELQITTGKLQLNAEIKRELRQYQMHQIIDLSIKHKPLILVAKNIYPAVKEKLREQGIAYLDSAGNIFLNNEHQFIWIDGNKLQKEENLVPNRAFTKTGLKVTYALLANENLIEMPYRVIADKANVALGNIQMVLTGLREGGYLLQLDKKKIILQNKKALLERWIAGYRETLKPALHLGNYQLFNPANWENLPLSNKDVWGGEPAGSLLTNYLSPKIFTIYTEDQKAKLIKNWKLVPNAHGNVQVYQKFWEDNEKSLLNTASSLLTYTDLLLTDDPRCLETAEIIYNKFLKSMFD